MSHREAGSRSALERFRSRLQSAFDSLPTAAEKQEIKSNTDALINFLSFLRDALETIPSKEDLDPARQALEKLGEFLRQAEKSPVLASALGLRQKSLSRRNSGASPTLNTEKAKVLLTELEALPVDDIRAVLNSESRSMEDLRLIAAAVGIRSTERLNREALAHQIAMKIANFRGYRQLGEDRARG